MSMVIGHRGSSSYPENSLSAIDYALRNGADGVEIDVRSTLDGLLVLSHDENLRRLTGQDVAVGGLTASDWKEMRVLGEPLATLEDALALVRSYGRLLDVEVKDPPDFPGVARTVRALGYPGVLVSSFWHRGAMELKRAHPDIRVGFIYAHQPADLSVYARLADYLKPQYEYIDQSYDPYRDRTIAWTVNDLKIAVGLLMRGMGVVTDVPGRVVIARNEHIASSS